PELDGALYDPALGAPVSNRNPELDGALYDPALGAPSVSAALSRLMAEPAFAGFKDDQSAAQRAPDTKPGSLFDFANAILNREMPAEYVRTSAGFVPLDPNLVHKDEVKALMGTPEYRTGKLRQSKPVRDTVLGYFEGAYPNKATFDLGRMRDIPDQPRTKTAPDFMRNAPPLSGINSPAPSKPDPEERKAAIGRGTVESLWEAVQKETDARRAAEQKAANALVNHDLAKRTDGYRSPVAYADDMPISSASSNRQKLSTRGFKPAESVEMKAGRTDKPSRIVSGIPSQMTAAAVRASRNARTVSNGRDDTQLGGGGRGDRTGDGRGFAKGRGPDGQRRWHDPGPDGPDVPDDEKKNVPGKPDAIARGLNSLFGNATNWAGTSAKGVGQYYDGTDNSGSRVICTELVRQGRLDTGLYFLDLRFAEQRLSPAHLRGYHLWAVPLVRLMRRSRLATAIIAPLARWRAEEVAHILGKRRRGSLRGKAVRLLGEPLCWLLGQVVRETDYCKLYEQEING
ncbi:MAG: hypothetical protein MI741_14275, partial [Rhodospirillales bacterium]|nr:hypothetical protein [Rhodospirillales bacterium]